MAAYTPAETAARSGFSVDTLRYYEREGILPPVARTSSGRRTYDDADLSLLALMRCLRDTGMPIQGLRRYGHLCRDADSLAERRDLLREHAEAVDRQITELQRWRTRLTEKIEWYDGELRRSR